MTNRRLGSHSPGMSMLRLFLASAALSLVTLASGCDRHPGPHFGPHDLPDLGDDVDEDELWTRTLEIGDFLYEQTTVHHWGDCTTTKTMVIEGHGGCSIGVIGVGIEQPDGTLVSGMLQPCGTMEWTETHSSESCGTDTAGTIEKFPAQLVMSAGEADDPIVLEVTADDPDLVISTTIFAATAIEDEGTAETVRLDGSATSADELDSKTVNAVVDFVVQ